VLVKGRDDRGAGTSENRCLYHVSLLIHSLHQRIYAFKTGIIR
jgi:hypothetical protein